jgi:hypothetical protein
MYNEASAMLKKITRLLLAAVMVMGVTMTSASGADIPNSLKLEKELQSLPWPRFRAVVEGIPKLRSEVERHGPFGWQYVRANYRTYPWKKNIDRLDPEQRQQLAALIQKSGNPASSKAALGRK